MSPNHDDVSELVNQAFNSHLQLQDLKNQLFHVADDLSSLCHAYDSLQVITANCGADAEHVGSVLYGLNYRFEALLERLEPLYKKQQAH